MSDALAWPAAEVVGRRGISDPDRLRLLLLDLIGVIVAGSQAPFVPVVESTLDEVAGGGARSIASGRCLSTQDAALVNGVAAHAFDYDDTHAPSLCHVSAAIVPALLAVADRVDAGFDEVVEAYEVGILTVASLERFGPAVNEARLHSTGYLGPVGAATACAWLLTQDVGTVERAAHLAGSLAGGIAASFGTAAKPLQAGRAAAAGVMAAQLAHAGLQGADDGLIGPGGLLNRFVDADAGIVPSTEGLASAVEAVSMKPYACCFLLHSPIDVIRELRARIGDDAAADGQLEVRVHPIVLDLAGKQDFSTSNDRRFSLLYTAWLAWRTGGIASEAFDPDETDVDAELLRGWSQNLDVIVDPSLHRLACEVSHIDPSGRRTTLRREDLGRAIGAGATPEQTVAKFRDNTQPRLGEVSSDEVRDLLLSHRGVHVREILDRISGSASPSQHRSREAVLR